ncbi:MAG: hypothetical protein ABEJ65_08980 [bacterium]
MVQRRNEEQTIRRSGYRVSNMNSTVSGRISRELSDILWQERHIERVTRSLRKRKS